MGAAACRRARHLRLQAVPAPALLLSILHENAILIMDLHLFEGMNSFPALLCVCPVMKLFVSQKIGLVLLFKLYSGCKDGL